MSQKLPCNLILGIQALALRVQPDEEFCVRKAAKLVNELVKYYEKKTNNSDPGTVMAMVALDLAMCGVKFNQEFDMQIEQINRNNTELLELVDSFSN
jgi:cell division protein ZapA (FtsZ GTPase activity inhibitor)